MEWWIWYRLKESDLEEVVVMPNVAKLMLWIAKFGHRCCEVSIRLLEG